MVNTEDALCIGKNGIGLKEILKMPELKTFGEKSTPYNCSWGRYEDLVVEKDYRFRRVIINSGKRSMSMFIREKSNPGRYLKVLASLRLTVWRVFTRRVTQ